MRSESPAEGLSAGFAVLGAVGAAGVTGTGGAGAGAGATGAGGAFMIGGGAGMPSSGVAAG